MNSKQQSNTLSIPTQQQLTAVTLERADIVIIGNGIAGLTAAIEARHYDPSKRIVMISDQPHPTINTPALKQFAINKLQREQLLAYPAGTERAERIQVVNARVEQIHAQSKYLDLSGNRAFGYKKLLIATGSQPIGLPEDTPGLTFDGVMMLHRLKDYLDLRRRLPEVHEAVVVGGGVHANETVMSLVHWGIRVHWLIRGKTFLSRTLDNTASEIVLGNVRNTGAIIHTETEVKGIVGRVGTVAGVVTNRGEMIPCQLVLSCTGTRPAQGLTKHCTLPMRFKNGILVDDQLQTSVRDIYAAGDVAALPNPQTGDHETRAQWYSAVTQGKIAGAMVVGHTEVAMRPFGVQWHATHLGKLSMLTVGDPMGTRDDKQTTIYTDMSKGNYCRIAIFDDRLVGYLSVGVTQPDGLSIKHLIDEGFPIRDIIKPLLKGNFDVREYLTKPQAHTAKNMVATRQLPLLEQLQVLELPDAEPYRLQSSTQVNATFQEEQIQTPTTEELYYEQAGQERQSDALLVLAQQSQQGRDDPRVFFKHERNTVTDNIPALNNDGRINTTKTAYNQKNPPVPVVTKSHETSNIWHYLERESLYNEHRKKVSNE